MQASANPTTRLSDWSGVTTSLYLKQDVPVPLPAVGPLAELLTVSGGGLVVVGGGGLVVLPRWSLL
jgi:hypothetical protein